MIHQKIRFRKCFERFFYENKNLFLFLIGYIKFIVSCHYVSSRFKKGRKGFQAKSNQLLVSYAILYTRDRCIPYTLNNDSRVREREKREMGRKTKEEANERKANSSGVD
jgi:hypothetical protein